MLDAVPMWLVYAGTVGLFLVASVVGHRVGHLLGGPDEDAGDEANLGALLAVLGLLLAFSFSMAESRYEQRKVLLLDEANAIGTAYLRAGLLPEPLRREVRDRFRAYVDLRLAMVSTARVHEAIAGADKLQEEIWSRVEGYAERNPTPTAVILMQAVNDVIDMQGKRLGMGLRNRMPLVIIGSLYGLAVMALFVMGMKRSGRGSLSHAVTVVALIVTLGMIVAMIVDLDRPGEGLMMVSQQAMRDVRASMGQ